MKIISLAVSSLLNVIVLIHMCEKISEKKINYLNPIFLTTVLLMTVYWSVSYSLTNSFFRIIISFLFLIIACLIFLKEKINKSVIISFFAYIILLISDVSYVLLNAVFFKFNNVELQNNVFGKFITNIIILLFAIIITYILNNKNNKFLHELSERLTERKSNSNLYTIFIAFISTIMLIYCVYFEPNMTLGLLFGIVVIIVYAIFTVKLVQEKTSNIKLQEDNKSIISSLKEYEKMYKLQRMKTHESKNDLSILRGMIDKKNKKALDYIDQLIELTSNCNSSWMEKLKIIPEGGLRGILYYKLLQMDENKVKINFSISSNYSAASYMELPSEIRIKICKILGIYLDNAIQAVSNLTDKNICLDIDEDKKNIIFKIGNNFDGNIDIDKIYDDGYSTKGENRGCGLAIAKEMFENTSSIINKTQIVKDYFIQEIRILKR